MVMSLFKMEPNFGIHYATFYLMSLLKMGLHFGINYCLTFLLEVLRFSTNMFDFALACKINLSVFNLIDN